jgi:hypothetical protein
MSLDVSGVWDIRYRVRVDEAIKGVSAGQIVVAYGSSTGSTCGANTLAVGGAIPVGLRKGNSGGWRRFQADVVGSRASPASLDGFRALAATVGTEVSPFESPNIEPAGSPETDDGKFNPAAGVVSFVGPPAAGAVGWLEPWLSVYWALSGWLSGDGGAAPFGRPSKSAKVGWQRPPSRITSGG